MVVPVVVAVIVVDVAIVVVIVMVRVRVTVTVTITVDSRRRNEVSNFCLGQFEKVEPFCEPLGWRVDINTRNSWDNSGSNETMQKVLALIV